MCLSTLITFSNSVSKLASLTTARHIKKLAPVFPDLRVSMGRMLKAKTKWTMMRGVEIQRRTLEKDKTLQTLNKIIPPCQSWDT